MMALLVLGALGALAAWRAPPRAASFFKARPQETFEVLAAGSAGTRPGAASDNDNANAAESQSESDRRLTLYKTSV